MGLFDKILRLFNYSKPSYESMLIKVIGEKYQLESAPKIYYIGGFEYSEDSYKEFLLSIKSNTLVGFLSAYQYNAQKDDIDLYLIDLNSSRSDIVAVFSPFELYSNDEVIDVFNAVDIDLNGLSKQEVV